MTQAAKVDVEQSFMEVDRRLNEAFGWLLRAAEIELLSTPGAGPEPDQRRYRGDQGVDRQVAGDAYI